MIDKKEKNREDLTNGTAIGPLLAPVAVKSVGGAGCTGMNANGNGKDLNPSKGELWFGDFFYNKMNYWFNLGVSVVITDWVRVGGGVKFLEKISNATSKMLAGGNAARTARL